MIHKAGRRRQSRKTSTGQSANPSIQLSTNPTAFPIVGVGASAGGLEAFTQLLKHLPLDTGMGFVLVQHLDPQHESALSQILTRATSMPVSEVRNNLRVEPNHVYVIPPNRNLGMTQGVLKLLPRSKTAGAHRSIDFFLESLAEDQRQCAIGVILSGTATDGTLGLEAVKADGGITFAQDESATHDSMPRSAIAAGCVDFVLSPENIARELAHIAKHPFVVRSDQDAVPCEHERESTRPPEALAHPDGFKNILLLLCNHCGVNFALYKPSTIERRITRRMVLHKLTSLSDYAAFLRGNAQELDALYSDVLINVTSFFRNPEAFELLKRKVFPKLLQQRRNDPLRVWVLACSTGQEAYSLAMALQEFVEHHTHVPRIQIFATDLNAAVLDKARAGFYAKAVVTDVSPERLRRFFVEEQGGYRVIKALREMIVFAPQNLLSDPPFSRMDLITCRNLLIYLEPDLQKKAVPTFHYALKPNGFLFLGASESISGYSELFEAVDKKHKIYTRKPAPTPALKLEFGLGAEGKQGAASPGPAQKQKGQSAELNTQREADRVTLKRHAPPSLLINADLQILEFRGDTSPYLKPPTGRASFHLLKMAREGLLSPLRAALNKAKKENEAVLKENVRMVQNGLTHTTNVEVVPLKNLKERCFLIFFEKVEKAGTSSAEPPIKSTGSKPRHDGKRSQSAGRQLSDANEPRRVAELRRELAEKDDYLQSVQEQYEAANEELQSSSEEVTSANEELQSINEELETSKEELESTNEELTTVNEEMAHRNTELNRVNSDLHNLLTSVSLAIVVVARDLTIRRFTPAAEKLFNLLAPDVGRPLSGIRHNLQLPNLEQLLKEVIDTVSVRERETQDKDGRWYSLRARPYLTLDNKIDGAVLVLMDITDLKRTEREAKAARDYAEATIRTARDPQVVLLTDLRVNTANQAFYHTFKTTPEQTAGRSIFELFAGAWNIPRLRTLLEDILPRNSFFNDFEVTHDFPGLGRRRMLLNARRLDFDEGTPMILLGLEDVTERQQLQEAKAFLASIVESSDDSIISINFDQIITSWNSGAERLYGYSAAEAIGKSLTMLSLPEGLKDALARVDKIKHGLKLETFEVERQLKDGRHLFVSVTMSLIKDASGHPIGLSTLSRDITERKQAEKVLSERARLLDLTDDAIIVRDLEGHIVYWNEGAEKLYGWPREEALGKISHSLLNTQFPKPFEQITEELLKTNRWEGEFVQTKRDGQSITLLVRKSLDRDRQGNPTAILETLTDITGRKQAEEKLHLAQTQLADRAGQLEQLVAERTARLQATIEELEHFSYTITHDMRAPLRAMQGFSDLLLNQSASQPTFESADYLRRIMEAANRMDALIQDSLQYAKVVRENVPLAPTEPTPILRGILESYPALQAPHVQIHLVEPLPTVLANEAGLAQCFSNLLDNAIKFVKPGTVPHVRVCAEIRQGADQPSISPTFHQSSSWAIVRFWFEDNGIGIPPDYQDRIFDMFQQIDKSYEGTGIGLALVRKTVERMNGKVGVESEPGKGSRFWLELQKAGESA